jgi:hypothetical protein
MDANLDSCYPVLDRIDQIVRKGERSHCEASL